MPACGKIAGMGSGRRSRATERSGEPRQDNRRARELALDALYRDETGTSKTCRDCGARFAARPWYRVRTVGHNIPLARVRAPETRSLVKYDQCGGCNADQGTRTPEEWRADQGSGAIEPIRDLTDEQKRLRARVIWQRARRRRTGRKVVELGIVPSYLLSHDEHFRLAVRVKEHAAADTRTRARAIEYRLAAGQKALEEISSWPERVPRLFGLVLVTDRRRLQSLASWKAEIAGLLAELRSLREQQLQAEARLGEVRATRSVHDCRCVTCRHDFDAREADYKNERAARLAQERSDRWHNRPTGFYRGRLG